MATKFSASLVSGSMVLCSGVGIVCAAAMGQSIPVGLFVGAAMGLIFGACVEMNRGVK